MPKTESQEQSMSDKEIQDIEHQLEQLQLQSDRLATRLRVNFEQREQLHRRQQKHQEQEISELETESGSRIQTIFNQLREQSPRSQRKG